MQLMSCSLDFLFPLYYYLLRLRFVSRESMLLFPCANTLLGVPKSVLYFLCANILDFLELLPKDF